MYSSVVNHLKEKINSATLQVDPYKWFEVQDIWPEDFYRQMLEYRISDECMFSLKDINRVKDEYSDDRLVLQLSSKVSILSQPNRGFWEGVANILQDHLGPMLLEKFGVDKSGATPSILYTRDRMGYKLGPHTDRNIKILTALFYLPKTDDNPGLGTAIFTPKQPGFTCAGGAHYDYDGFNLHRVMPYIPNKLFCFLKSTNSFHGVYPIEADVNRDLLIFDLSRKVC